MNIVLATGLFSLLSLVCIIRLMADGKRLETRLVERQTEFRELSPETEAMLIKDDYATWMAPPF